MDLSQLNAPQRASVQQISNPLLVLAGAGSGKTRVITHKIAYLILKCGIPAYQIAAVTFTNKAAAEMRERVGVLLCRAQTRGLSIGTFHQFGLNFLRKEAKQLGFNANFSIFDDLDVKQTLKEVMFQADIENAHLDYIRHKISLWKNQLLSPEQTLSIADTPLDEQAARCFVAYQRLLTAYNAVDFDDLVVKPCIHLAQCPSTRERWQNKIHYLLVDEYQDTNACQYELVKQLVGVRQQFTVVGDDDQSIYGWRGAQPDNLQHLNQDFPNLNIIKLEQNYRSNQNILGVANGLIAHNPHVFEKRLWSALGHGGLIKIQKCLSEEDEADWIVGHLLHQKLQSQHAFSDFAVLYRSNYQSRLLEIKLQAMNIPYHVSGGTSFFARAEVKDLLAYLRLIINPVDDNAFLRIINTPRREIGAATLEKLGQYATSREISMYEAISEFGLTQTLSGKALDRLQRFKVWLSQLEQRCYEADSIAPINQLLTDIDYEQWLLDQSASVKVGERRWGNVQQLLASMDKLLKELEPEKLKSGQSPLEGVINQLIVRDIIDQQKSDESDYKVQLMTLHAAKGLEFPQVYLMGLEEDILPHKNSKEEGSLEEERRLLYVGITRAQQSLTLTLCTERKQFGEKYQPEPSRFIDELPKSLLEFSGHGVKKSESEKQAIGQSYLSGLKSMFEES